MIGKDDIECTSRTAKGEQPLVTVEVRHSKSPATELRCRPAAAGKSLDKLSQFVTEKQPTSIALGWSEPVPGRELHSAEVQRFRGALFRQTTEAPAT